MRRPAVAIARAAFNALYRVRRRRERADEVVFLSRQTERPSYDFTALAREFEARGWKATMHLKKVTRRNLAGYARHVVTEIGLLGRCKAVVIDRFDPVVSLIDFESESADGAACPAGDPRGAVLRKAGAGRRGSGRGDGRGNGCEAPAYVAFPRAPLVFQMWHAFGAYKKFGFQSMGTPESHPPDVFADYLIHRNCSWVACSGEGARVAFSEAFSCPPDRVVALGRPEFDELVALRRERLRLRKAGPASAAAGAGASRPRVLMAPTLRKGALTAHPFRELHERRGSFEGALRADVVWAFHPLEEGRFAPGNVSRELLGCDVLVTDYSSVVYEAYLLGVPALFYVPDLEAYRAMPGLNCDPAELAPDLCAMSAPDLAVLVARTLEDPAGYPLGQLESFAAAAFDWTASELDSAPIPPAAGRIADFIESRFPPSA